MAVVHLIRHGQASFGAAQYDELSALGRTQAQTVGRVLLDRGLRLDRVVSGSLCRQRDTARLALEAAGLELGVQIDNRWNEYDHLGLVAHHVRGTGGPLPDAVVSPRSFQALLDAALSKWMQGDENPPGLPTWAAFGEHVGGGLEDLLTDLGRGGSAAVFTSGGVITAICARLWRLSPAGGVALHRVVVNGGITKVISGRGGISLISFNDHAHFEGLAADQLTYR